MQCVLSPGGRCHLPKVTHHVRIRLLTSQQEPHLPHHMYVYSREYIHWKGIGPPGLRACLLTSWQFFPAALHRNLMPHLCPSEYRVQWRSWCGYTRAWRRYSEIKEITSGHWTDVICKQTHLCPSLLSTGPGMGFGFPWLSPRQGH